MGGRLPLARRGLAFVDFRSLVVREWARILVHVNSGGLAWRLCFIGARDGVLRRGGRRLRFCSCGFRL